MYARLDPNSSLSALNASMLIQNASKAIAATPSADRYSAPEFNYTSPNAIVITREWKEHCLWDVQVGVAACCACMRHYTPFAVGH